MMVKKFKELFLEEEGQGMTEYGLILGLIALVAIGILGTMGDSIKQVFTDANDELQTALTPD